MSKVVPIRAVLMAAEIKEGGTGFHRLVFKVDGGRTGMFSTTVLISQDACRKLTAQMQRARVQRMDRASLLKTWARWEIAQRMDETGLMPDTVTITASDLDDYGAYAMDLARSLAVG
ncbi:MAG: hypothetical protein HUU14_08300 [Dehalococcoidia bacterium]|nr:MAG: hypothetical protein EDM76_04465 [bacterium]MCE7927801.1 hypothetical protein [Chloroflexi bacterium CFX7]MCK6563982.1 hypothetical protein [Dehalococcoidia bacterium]MCL4230296.1 hypothetical protein [Dehalococcoidia bacterium]NUQ55870.1 hypothetical protein [Dehalococcoidia bacterium]